MPEAFIVVQAKWPGGAACNHEVCQNTRLNKPVYGYNTGEQGTLDLKNTAKNLYTRETYVLWDNDPDEQFRQVTFEDIEIVGIQIEGHRLIVHPK